MGDADTGSGASYDADRRMRRLYHGSCENRPADGSFQTRQGTDHAQHLSSPHSTGQSQRQAFRGWPHEPHHSFYSHLHFAYRSSHADSMLLRFLLYRLSIRSYLMHRQQRSGIWSHRRLLHADARRYQMDAVGTDADRTSGNIHCSGHIDTGFLAPLTLITQILVRFSVYFASGTILTRFFITFAKSYEIQGHGFTEQSIRL